MYLMRQCSYAMVDGSTLQTGLCNLAACVQACGDRLCPVRHLLQGHGSQLQCQSLCIVAFCLCLSSSTPGFLSSCDCTHDTDHDLCCVTGLMPCRRLPFGAPIRKCQRQELLQAQPGYRHDELTCVHLPGSFGQQKVSSDCLP